MSITAGKNSKKKQWIVRTQAEVAQFFGLSVQTVKQWRSESPPMPGREGAWPLDQIAQWRQAKLNNRAENPLRSRREAVEIEKKEAEIRRLLRQEEEALGNLLPLDVYQEFVRELLTMVRSSLEELPETIADTVPQKERRKYFVPEHSQRSERDASPVQKAVRKIIQDVQAWLDQDPREETE